MEKLLFFSNLVMILTFLFRLSRLPPQLPLFYSKPWGEDQLVDSWLIFILPVLMNSFYFLNNWFYKKFFRENFFVKKIIDYLNLFLVVFTALFFLKIIFIVT